MGEKSSSGATNPAQLWLPASPFPALKYKGLHGDFQQHPNPNPAPWVSPGLAPQHPIPGVGTWQQPQGVMSVPGLCVPSCAQLCLWQQDPAGYQAALEAPNNCK